MSTPAFRTSTKILFGAVFALLCGVVLLSRSGPPARTAAGTQEQPSAEDVLARMPPPAIAAPVAPAPTPAPVDDEQIALARALIARLAVLYIPGRKLSDEEKREIETTEARLLTLGDAAVGVLIARLDAGSDAPGGRELMFNVLRRLPGEAVEQRLVAEAQRSQQPAMRTMAIESLAARPTDNALAALGDIARNDPELPAHPFYANARDPRDTSTELPDETVFSPRMQAMSALASTNDPRAVDVLTDVVKSGPDESLRMQAARHLESLRNDPRAEEVLRVAAAEDPSAYVRLAALRSLQGASDPSLAPLLEGIAARDRDAGVRILAQQLLTGLRR